MSDWKGKVEAYQTRLSQQNERKRLEDQRRQEVQQQKEFARKLANLQARFRCVVCGKLPTGPSGDYYEGSSSSPGMDGGGGRYVPIDWDNPTGLWKCNLGNHWACEDHIYKDICQKCAEKL